MSKASVVKFACGKYGVRDGIKFYSPLGYYFTDSEYVARHCKMYKWQAKRLLKRINTTVVEEL